MSANSVDYENIIKLDKLNSVLITLDMETRMNLRGWIHHRFNSQEEVIVRNSVDKTIYEACESMGLQYQIKDFGEFGATHLPMSLYAEGVLIPEIYFT